MKTARVQVGGDLTYLQRLSASDLLRDVAKFYPDVTEIFCHVSNRQIEFSGAIKIRCSNDDCVIIHEIRPNLNLLKSALIKTACSELAGRKELAILEREQTILMI